MYVCTEGYIKYNAMSITHTRQQYCGAGKQRNCTREINTYTRCTNIHTHTHTHTHTHLILCKYNSVFPYHPGTLR
jgi:hypothetical protein